MKPYYYIYRVGYTIPSVKIYSLTDAVKEAERLSGQHKGDTFEIVLCVGITQTTKPTTFFMDGVHISQEWVEIP